MSTTDDRNDVDFHCDARYHADAIEEETRWEKLVNAAYEKWREGPSISYEQFLASLDAKERQAVLLGNMDGQINNGGVQQWVDNGYACTAVELFAVLNLMGSPRATEWAAKLEEFVGRYVNTRAKDKGFGQNYWLDDGDDEDEEPENLPYWSDADVLSDFYYSDPFYGELKQEIEEFLSK